MKKITLCFVFSLLLAVCGKAAEPENFVPSQSKQIVRMNANSIISMPHLKNMLNMADEKCRKVFLLLDELKKHGIEPATFFAGELWAAKTGAEDNDGVILIKTALPETKFAEFFKSQKAANRNVELAITTLAGKTIYTGRYSQVYQAAGAEPFFAVYLAGDVIALMPLTDRSGLLLTELQQGGNNPLINVIDRKSLAALLTHAQNKKEKIRSINGKLDLTGPEKRDIAVEAVLTCKNAKTALRKAMEMQFIIPTFSGLFFGNDPQLMEELSTVMQIVPVKEQITLKLNLSKTLQDRIVQYLANPANIPSLNINSPDSSNNMQQ